MDKWNYRIPLDGTNTDVRVVFETNGRYLSVDNGVGGSVAIYREGNDMPLRTIGSGGGFYGIIPKTANPYAVITPQEGMSVTSILRGGVLLSPSTYLQSDGTYRVPLEGFDRGDSFYALYIIFSEDVAVVESTGITWSGVATGELLEEANTLEAMLNNDANYRVLTNLEKTYSTFSQKFDNDANSLKVSLTVKDGYDFKVWPSFEIGIGSTWDWHPYGNQNEWSIGWGLNWRTYAMNDETHWKKDNDVMHLQPYAPDMKERST